MVLTDIPDSGVYIPFGAVTTLVIKITDANTGAPVQLQNADNLYISILYPDRVTSVNFPASLYSDGSDGMISYTTVNEYQGIVDLDQAGLYSMQGLVSIGGVPLPPSTTIQFYVTPPISQPPVASVFPAIAVFDQNGSRWIVTINSNGNLITTLGPMPSGCYTTNPFILRDSNGTYWQISALVSGNLVTNPVSNPPSYSTAVNLKDELSQEWTLKILPTGNLQTVPDFLLPSRYTAFMLTDSNGTPWSVVPNTRGNLVTNISYSTPAGAFTITPFVLQASDGTFYQVVILPTGQLVTHTVANPPVFSSGIFILDRNGHTWFLSVQPGGNLVTQ